jgi:hypothetical protein
MDSSPAYRVSFAIILILIPIMLWWQNIVR